MGERDIVEIAREARRLREEMERDRLAHFDWTDRHRAHALKHYDAMVDAVLQRAQSPAPAWTREVPASDGPYWTRSGPGAEPELLAWKEDVWLFGSERAFGDGRMPEHWPVRLEPPK